jgi:hypothetical protein
LLSVGALAFAPAVSSFSIILPVDLESYTGGLYDDDAVTGVTTGGLFSDADAVTTSDLYADTVTTDGLYADAVITGGLYADEDAVTTGGLNAGGSYADENAVTTGGLYAEEDAVITGGLYGDAVATGGQSFSEICLLLNECVQDEQEYFVEERHCRKLYRMHSGYWSE